MSLPDGARLRVRRGAPTPAESAALVLALDLALAAEHPAAAPTLPSWRWAARLEGTGTTPLTAPADLEAARRRPLG